MGVQYVCNMCKKRLSTLRRRAEEFGSVSSESKVQYSPVYKYVLLSLLSARFFAFSL